MVARPALLSFLLLLLLLVVADLASSDIPPSPAPRGPILAPPSPTPLLPPSPAPVMAPAAPSPAFSPTMPPASSPSPTTPPTASPAPANEVFLDGEKSNQKGEFGASSCSMSGWKKAGVTVGVLAAAAVAGLGALVYKKRRENIRRSRYGYTTWREMKVI